MNVWYTIFNMKSERFIDKELPNNWGWNNKFHYVFTNNEIKSIMSDNNLMPIIKVSSKFTRLYYDILLPNRNNVLIVPIVDNELNFIKAFKL